MVNSDQTLLNATGGPTNGRGGLSRFESKSKIALGDIGSDDESHVFEEGGNKSKIQAAKNNFQDGANDFAKQREYMKIRQDNFKINDLDNLYSS